MKKIMFNEKYGLNADVLNGNKTMTRRIIPLTDANREYLDNAFDWDLQESVIIERYAQYEVGEIVAVAQRYIDLCNCSAFYEALAKADPTFPLECIKGEKGCYNKMFVKADWMPHHIRITDIKIERLQDIGDEDCMNEGVIETTDGFTGEKVYTFLGSEINYMFATTAFADLIDKVSGKGTWDSNPWVFAYSFELVD